MMGSMSGDGNPIFGITSIPKMGFLIEHSCVMNAREVLAANFKKLRDATPSLNAPKDIVAAGAATNGTIGRITKKQSGPSIDTIEQLARAYGLEAWQMLVPALEAHPGKNGMPVVSGVSPWPFLLVDRRRYEALPELAKGAAQSRMMDEVIQQEGKLHKGNGTNGP